MYRIGIMDDVKSDCADIQVSILDNAGWDAEIEFKEYELEARTCDDIAAEIQQDVNEGNMHTLIVDFQLDTTAAVIKGWEIIKFMHEVIPEFPVIIVTNAPDETKESQYTDADKVYAKKVFLKPELDITKELVRNIMLNMGKYVSRRKELEERLEIELNRLDDNWEGQDTLEEVIKIENKLSKYKQLYQTRVDKALNLSDLKDTFEDLRKYEKLLG